jgi:hypothetical protein
MLTFDEKLSIIESFPELQRKDVSLGRVNFQYEDSVFDKKNVVYHLHPSGNGFVYAGMLAEWDKDDKGMVNIRDFTKEELKKIVTASIESLSAKSPKVGEQAIILDAEVQQRWVNTNGHTLILLYEDEMWYIYNGLNLEDAYETFDEAEHYLRDEGFTQQYDSESGR